MYKEVYFSATDAFNNKSPRKHEGIMMSAASLLSMCFSRAMFKLLSYQTSDLPGSVPVMQNEPIVKQDTQMYTNLIRICTI